MASILIDVQKIDNGFLIVVDGDGEGDCPEQRWFASNLAEVHAWVFSTINTHFGKPAAPTGPSPKAAI